MPMISVVVAVFNGESTLQHCIDSFAQQSYRDKELIIIDGGSKDGTIELLMANRNLINYWISEPDDGIYSAWNKGVEHANGEWICFLGADDYFWNSEVLECLAKDLKKLPSHVRVAYGKIMLINNRGENIYLIGEPWHKIKSRFKQIMCIPHPGTMHRRSLFELHGKFDETFRIAGDYEFLLRELKTANACFFPEIITVAMLQEGISSNPQNSLVQLHEVRFAQRKNGLRFPGRFWLLAIAKVIIRELLWDIMGERRARKILDLGRQMFGLQPFWTKT